MDRHQHSGKRFVSFAGMSIRKNGIRFLVICCLTSACTSFVPLSYHGAGSSATAKIAATEATMYLQHMDNQYQHLVFDLEITNHNSYAVPLVPEQISYYFSATRFPLRRFNDVDSTASVIRLRRKRFRCAACRYARSHCAGRVDGCRHCKSIGPTSTDQQLLPAIRNFY